MTGKLGGFVFAVLALAFAFPPSARAQLSPGSAARPMITAPIIENNLVSLLGNIRPEANAANDRGLVPNALPMEHMLLQLQRPAAQEQALAQFIDQLHDPHSANFRRWLTPDQFGTQFGPAASDVAQVTSWLQGRGFRVNVVYPSGMTIDFSGTAGQVLAAFHTEIHFLEARGTTHFANMSAPQIPAALAPAIVGIVSLNDFRPRPNLVPKAKVDYTFSGCGANCYAVTPADVATIYNFNPLFSGGKSGQGQTIYLIEDSNLYTDGDWTTFRSTFGLSSFSGATLNTVHPAPPSGPNNCSDPGINDDAGEAALDAEWASAAAPSAAIVMATCANSGTTFGGLLAIQNLINGPSPPAIISLSYGECEVVNGAAANAAFNSIYQQGVAEGTSIFVASGDWGAGACDNANPKAVTHGIGVNAFASTPYNVAVGGTDFGDTYAGTSSSYWNAGNTATFGSAKSYVPEVPWNDSCASKLLATFEGYANPYGSSGFCNSAAGSNFLNNAAGSGGPSGCATGTPSTASVVSGSCAGYAKPSWQTGVIGIPNDAVRGLPDVSLFSANGLWGHYYVYCWSDPARTSQGSAPCTGAPSGWSGAGGTSFAAPIMAGIQALVNQKAGGSQGNPNYRLYQLAAKEYGASGSSTCNSSNGNTAGASCIFYDVTLGDIDADCQQTHNCYRPSGTYGVLSTSNSSYLPAYGTKTGWDFATGIGTVNVSNLVANWVVATATVPHDFNGDGKSDIVWRDTSGNTVVWLMNGATVLSSGGIGMVPTAWTIVGQRDFDGDGKADLLWRDASGNTAIWFMNGAAVSSTGSVGTVSTVWTVDSTADFNGDSKGDLLWSDTSGNLSTWFMNGATVTSSAGLGNVPTAWTIIATDDFDGDGKPDILWRDTSGNLAMWFMNGATVASSAGVGNISAAWSLAGTGDFNGDGKFDLLWRDTAGNTAIWFMNGAAVSSSAGLGNVSTIWSIIQIGDYDGDGKSDILWRDSNGNTSMWFMNGATITSSGSLGNVPTAWTVQSTNAE